MIKKKIGEFIYLIIAITVKVRLAFYKQKNKSKAKAFLFTDSRGYDVTKMRFKYNPFSFYSKYFIKKFNTDCFVCPYKSTTVYDFLDTYHNLNKGHYAFVIAHIGVVDFATRPLSQARDILKDKKEKIVRFFGEETYHRLIEFEGYKEEFNGEKTSSTAPEFMIELIAKKFNKIENLIWISCNEVDLNWNGNYKSRPKNINKVWIKSKIMLEYLNTKTVIDLSNLSGYDVKRYTCDNVHLTNDGSDYILNNLKQIISKNYKQ